MTFLFIASDSPHKEEVYRLVELLDVVEGNFGYKVNLDFIVKNDLGVLRDIPTGRPKFADVKMWNGVRTMKEVCLSLQSSGVSYTNVYLQAGIPMLRELVEEVKTLVPPIKLLGLTVLTHYDNSYCLKQYRESMESKVLHLTKDALEAGLHGVILPGTMLHTVAGIPMVKLVPAVRPLDYVEKRGDQKQAITVGRAISWGASIVVCGSPITRANNPRVALEALLEEIAGAENRGR